jgi:lysophospholipase L1-like esterase
VRYTGSQLAFAVSFLRANRGVRLVSLMIGANDVFLCERNAPHHCTTSDEQRAVFKQVAANVRTILSAVRNRARYRGQLAILNYYSTDFNSTLLTNGVIGLNRALDAAAKPFTVVIADGFAQFKTASFRFGNNPCNAGLITQLGAPGNCGVHPTYAGQALLAQALTRAIRLN